MVIATRRLFNIPSFPFNNFKFLEGLVLFAPLWNEKSRLSPFKSLDHNLHTLTVTGTTWGSQGRTFTIGSVNYINCGNSAVFDITEAITVAYWIKFTAIDGVLDHYICVKGTNQYMSQMQTTGRLRWYLANPTADIQSGIKTTGVWYFFTGTYDRANVYLYVNGIQEATVAKTLAIGTDTGNFIISNYSDLLQEPNSSILGELMVYNRAFTPAEILRLYQVTKWRYSG